MFLRSALVCKGVEAAGIRIVPLALVEFSLQAEAKSSLMVLDMAEQGPIFSLTARMTCPAANTSAPFSAKVGTARLLTQTLAR